MYLRELIEAAKTTWGRSADRTVRKYKCTSGPRKGRIVAKASTCTAPVNVMKSKRLKQTKLRKSAPIKIKAKRTKSFSPGSLRVARLNKARRKATKRRTSKRKR